MPQKILGRLIPKRKTIQPKRSFNRFIGLSTALVLVGFLAGIWAYWNLPKAEVTIFVSAKPIDKQLTFTIDPSVQSIDSNGKIVPGQTQTITVSGSKTMATTGTITVGERAAGEVTIYNRTAAPKNFAAGTAIKNQNLRFTLDNEVTVASASTKYNADFSVTTEPSKANAPVTAVDIGDQYNLAAGTQFTVANFSQDSFVAVNTNVLSGGSAREVAAVSDKDLANLKADLIAELAAQVADKLRQEIRGKEVITTTNQTASDQSYSANRGDEAENVTLELTLQQLVYTYSMADVTELAQAASFADIPPGYSIQSSQTKVEVLDTVINDDGTATVTTNTSLGLLPKLNVDDVAVKIKGKKPPLTNDYFHTLPGFVRSSIVITPTFPEAFATLPHRVERIHIQVEPATN